MESLAGKRGRGRRKIQDYLAAIVVIVWLLLFPY
jgi:hypothetical protein